MHNKHAANIQTEDYTLSNDRFNASNLQVFSHINAHPLGHNATASSNDIILMKGYQILFLAIFMPFRPK